MKPGNYIVVNIDKQDGKILFLSEKNGFDENPLHAGVYNELTADIYVKRYTDFINENAPHLMNQKCISKVRLS